MSTSRQSEETIANAARRMEDEARTVFLERTCGADSKMRRRVESLLAESDSTPSSDPAGPSGTVIMDDDDATVSEIGPLNLPSEEAVGDVIGRYKLLEKIGEGGFGLVYIAEQTEPVKRRVALKIIKLGMDTRQVVGRFELERQALALMDHPNIAKVLDAGATDTGRPYFVMELVRGTKITEYCDRNKLSTHDRLDLFILVCRAIEHAHQKGIIHRDIKPSNILVTMNDGVASPKVIDFGIAKATQGNLTEKTVYTQVDQFVGTPAYMSPEQAEASGLDIDTRSDIYSLGVLLYELLTGETPLESKNLLSRGLDEMRRLIREWEPQLPSIRLNRQGAEDQTTHARRHGTDVPKLIKMVRGDLDWVVMKCLEKDRARRYDSAAQLTSEIQRFLANEPVNARPPSNLYRLQKMVRRNRLAFAAGSAVFLSLIIGLCVTSWFMVKEKEQRDLAEIASKNSDKARQIAEDALTQAQAAREQSGIDRRQTGAALQRSEADRNRAAAADVKAAAAEKEAALARDHAQAAAQQAKEDRAKAAAAEKAADDARAAAQAALEQARTAQATALSATAKSEAATQTAAAETKLRQQADVARMQAEAALKQAEASTAAALAQAGQLSQTISNVLTSLNALPPAEALQAASALGEAGGQPWTAQFLRQRGEWRARTADWKNAAADFSQALDLDQASLPPYHALASLLAQLGQTEALARHDARFLAQFSATNDPAILRQVARDCVFAPVTGIDLGTVAALAQRSAATGTNGQTSVNTQLTLGLLGYRQGHYAEAAALLGQALSGSGLDLATAAQAGAALAMAQQQLKQTNNARLTLNQSRQIIDTRSAKQAGGDQGPDWSQWLMAHALVHEAGALIEAPAAAAAK